MEFEAKITRRQALQTIALGTLVAACAIDRTGRQTLSGAQPSAEPELSPSPIVCNTPSMGPDASPIVSPVPSEAPRTELILRPGEVVEHGDRSKPEIFFTIDDGWDKKEVIRILDIAKDLGANLTFFAVGDNVVAFPEVWRRAYEEGHSIQNHSMTHPNNIHQLPEDVIRKQITDQLEAVRNAIGVPDYIQHSFRPPYGVGAPPWYDLSPRLQKVCADLGLAITTWTSLSPAWDGKHTTRQVEKALGSDITNGSILVLHDEPADIKALPDLIKEAQQASLKPRNLDALFT